MIKLFGSKQLEKKENPVGSAFFMNTISWMGNTDKKALAEEGYKQNVIVYRAIREITNAIADISIELHKDGEYQESITEPLELINRPNPMQGFDQFIKNVFTDYLITGEMFIAKPEGQERPAELWALNPLNMHVKGGRSGMPESYIHEVNGRKKTFPVDSMTGKSDLFFLKMYDPCNYWRGLAPLQAAALSADTHNSGMRWNYSLLKNGARPSGIIQFKEEPSDEVLNRLREFFKKTIQGDKNAGSVPMLTGGGEWKAMDNNPRDMDYLNTMKEMSKYVASAFGVPLPLIDNDAASYNNMEQAKERLWTDTVIPMFNEFLNAFGNWLLPAYGENLSLVANLDDIPALEGVRERKFKRMVEAKKEGVLTTDEARVAIGYEPKGGNADMLLVPSNTMPIDLTDSFDDAVKALGYDVGERKAIEK